MIFRYTFLLSLALAVIIGSCLAARSVTMNGLTNQNSIFDSFENVDGTWLYSETIGATAASSIERARVAINGPLGLSSKEAVYFVALQDNTGKPLRSQCSYIVSGKPIDARWWSLTLYDSVTQHYVPNAINRSSWNSATLPRSETGDWSITVAPTPQDGSWLPSQEKADQPFDLMLRVYNPSLKLRSKIPDIELPSVELVSC